MQICFCHSLSHEDKYHRKKTRSYYFPTRFTVVLQSNVQTQNQNNATKNYDDTVLVISFRIHNCSDAKKDKCIQEVWKNVSFVVDFQLGQVSITCHFTETILMLLAPRAGKQSKANIGKSLGMRLLQTSNSLSRLLTFGKTTLSFLKVH